MGRIAGNDEMIVPTRHGHRLALFRPDPDSICIEDIAAGLARKYRWSGQCDLTVAEHSVNVSRRLGGYEAQWGLLHDAAEAYLADIARPLKRRTLVDVSAMTESAMYERIQHIENRLLHAIGKRFGLAWPMPEAVHVVDDKELGREARDLFGDPVRPDEAFPERLEITPAPLVEAMFLRRFAELFREPAGS